MYIVFDLSFSVEIGTSSVELLILRKEISNWATQYSIPYREKTVFPLHRLCLESQKDYTFFLTSWQPLGYAARQYRVINIP